MPMTTPEVQSLEQRAEKALSSLAILQADSLQAKKIIISQNYDISEKRKQVLELDEKIEFLNNKVNSIKIEISNESISLQNLKKEKTAKEGELKELTESISESQVEINSDRDKLVKEKELLVNLRESLDKKAKDLKILTDLYNSEMCKIKEISNICKILES